MGGSLLRAGRRGFSSPRRFALFLVIVEGFYQAGEHFRRSLEERLGLWLRDFTDVLAQMLDELTHPSLDFLRMVNGVILRREFHASRPFLETWCLFSWPRPLFLPAGVFARGTLMSSAALKSISCSCSCTMIARKVSLSANSPIASAWRMRSRYRPTVSRSFSRSVQSIATGSLEVLTGLGVTDRKSTRLNSSHLGI